MTDLALREFALVLAEPLATARGEVTERRGLLVGVERDGVRGVGEATPLPGWTESFADCRAALAAADIEEEALPSARETPAARHGLELALLDADARRRGDPLAATLADGDPATAVPVNATVGDAPADETAAAVREAAAAGFPCVKVKVGVGGVERDAERLRAARAATDVSLRADANGAWDRETAAAAVEAFAPLDLAYLEQPLPADDLDGHRALRGRGVRIAVDETLATHSVERVLDSDAADVAVLKPMALGGVTRTLSGVRSAREAGVEPVVTTTVDAAVARTAAVHAAAAVPDVAPCGLATRRLLSADLVPDPVPVTAGRIRPPDAPGLAGAAFADLV